MNVELRHERGMRLVGLNGRGARTFFEDNPAGDADQPAASPMEVMLESMAACSAIDVLYILEKMRKTVTDFRISVSGERPEKPPRVFTRVDVRYELTSPDATLKDLDRAVELSMTVYCSASAMFRASGCEIAWETVLHAAP